MAELSDGSLLLKLWAESQPVTTGTEAQLPPAREHLSSSSVERDLYKVERKKAAACPSRQDSHHAVCNGVWEQSRGTAP